MLHVDAVTPVTLRNSRAWCCCLGSHTSSTHYLHFRHELKTTLSFLGQELLLFSTWWKNPPPLSV